MRDWYEVNCRLYGVRIGSVMTVDHHHAGPHFLVSVDSQANPIPRVAPVTIATWSLTE